MNSLENQLLIAMPSLGDPYFSKTVTYICEHNSEGAMGLIINLPVNISLLELLKQIDQSPVKTDNRLSTLQHEAVENRTTDDDSDHSFSDDNEMGKAPSRASDDISEKVKAELIQEINEQSSLENPQLAQPVLSGGPIAQQRGFVLHSPQAGWNSSLSLSDDLMITTSKDILLTLGTAEAPEKYIVTLGYAGWGPGQLEEELQSNSWLTTPVDNDILFNTPIEMRWKKATEKLGIDLAHLSTDVGHA